eukprot:2323957-Amphidinium_carterae.1
MPTDIEVARALKHRVCCSTNRKREIFSRARRRPNVTRPQCSHIALGALVFFPKFQLPQMAVKFLVECKETTPGYSDSSITPDRSAQ